MVVKKPKKSDCLLVGVTEKLLAEIEEKRSEINQNLSAAETTQSK